MNVFDFAMEMEDNGYVYYTNLARSATLPGLKTIFSSLAEDECKHFKLFRELKAGNEEWSMAESDTLVTAKNVFSLLPRSTELREISGVLPAYKHAMKLEADSFRFYEEAADKENNPGVKALLLKIAGEEHQHFNILENLYNFVNVFN